MVYYVIKQKQISSFIQIQISLCIEDKRTLKSPNTNTITNSKYIRYNSSNNIIEKPAFLNKFAVFSLKILI